MDGFFGTEYMPKIETGDILFAGVFEKIGGLILGKHGKFDDNGTGKQPYVYAAHRLQRHA